ncbi:PepSY domain-containing protein [Fulvivirga maritima]|uniref:PepSY-associated TM helix domain-containing protein n=1 Tax=Fulvivirga maritima TaxID=2904247 RepID=UPI001F1DBEC6|nr:PepSY-associated TM helix domain-containing protein [Fulvivirga maritima]UII25718.1 PepSY domain-containing protein [Fulvivirga maritima]
MNKRVYNVFFNVHTVSGIVMSVGLFVCFLAGAFALFMGNINKWQINAKSAENVKVDYEGMISVLDDEGYNLNGRTMFMQLVDDPMPFVMVMSRPVRGGEKGATRNVYENSGEGINPNGAISLKIDPETFKIIDSAEAEPSNYLGTFLYHLHYFDQIPRVGLYLSGFVSLFFLLAIISGTIVHWRKIVSNFFTFRLKASIKNFWTDGHTALGIIGLPFQFMYAVTGAMLGLLVVVLIPASMVLFGGNTAKLLGYIAPAYKTYEKANEIQLERENINDLVQQARKDLDVPDYKMAAVNVVNYNDKNAYLMAEFRQEGEKTFFDDGHVVYRLNDGEQVEIKPFGDNGLTKGGVLHTIRKLHYAHFGGYFMKIIYFILALGTCYVILSGVMIWLEARNSKKYASKKKFNTAVDAIYMGTCMGLLPAIAFFFCLAKLMPEGIVDRFAMMSNIFFLFWLGYIVYAFIIKDLYKINKHALFLTGILGLIIPVLNGITAGMWFWKALPSGYYDSFFVDCSWLLLGAICLIVSRYVKRLKCYKKVKAAQV